MDKYQDKKCFIYARKATKEQTQTDEEAVADQMQQLQKLAKEKGISVTHTFIEVDSGCDKNRKQLQKMLELLKTSDTKIVLCTSIDRLSRDFSFIAKIDQLLKTNQVILMTPDYTYGESAVSDFKWDVSAYFAKAFSNQLSERIKAGIRRKREREAVAKVTI